MKNLIVIILSLSLFGCENTADKSTNATSPAENPELQLNIYNRDFDVYDISENLKFVDIFYENYGPYENERFEFDENNKVVRFFINYDSTSQKSTHFEEFKYDTNGRVIHSKIVRIIGDKKDTTVETSNYKYIESDNKIIWSHDKDGVTERYTTTGKVEKNKIIYKTVDSIGNTYSIYNYDFNGNRTYSKKESAVWNFEYDKENRLIKVVYTLNGILQSNDTYKYRNNNRYPYQVLSLVESEAETTNLDYELDKRGNWILCKSDTKYLPFEDGGIITSRRIHYRK